MNVPPSLRPRVARELALTELSEPQLGLFTPQQAMEVGFPPSTIRDRVGRRVWERWAPKALGRSGLPRTWERRLLAAVLNAGPGAAAARASAARLWDLPTGRRNPLEIVVPYARCVDAPNDRVVVHRSRTLTERDTIPIASIPTTTADRTIADLCGERSVQDLSEMMAIAIRRGNTTLADLVEREAAAGRLRGIRKYRAAYRRLDPDVARSRAARETSLVGGLVRAGLPRPEVGHKVFDDDGQLIAELDLAYVPQKVDIEVDGFVWHSSPSQKRHDADRQNRLVLLGWRVLRFTTEDVDRRLTWVTRQVASALGMDLV